MNISLIKSLAYVLTTSDSCSCISLCLCYDGHGGGDGGGTTCFMAKNVGHNRAPSSPTSATSSLPQVLQVLILSPCLTVMYVLSGQDVLIRKEQWMQQKQGRTAGG